MAKKTVINDFSALKGKVNFQEQKLVVPETKPSVRPASVTMAKESSLKVGQSVVLMDSDLRGRIVSIGRKVGIELEDGLVIEASYGEFAVTSLSELSSLKETKVKAKRTDVRKTSSSGASASFGGSISVDLHIEAIPGGRSIPKSQQLQFQLETFRKVIRQNLSHKGMTITFIHGIGDGILKAAIRKELDEVLALRCSYSVGDPAVTIVTIR
mgnify:FL=1